MKTCSKCQENKSFDCFYKSKQTKDGFRPECNDCRRAYEKSRYQSLDKDKVNAQVRARYAKNKDSILSKNRDKYHQNLEQERARNKRYREKNAEHIREKSKIYYAANKEKERGRLELWKAANPDRASMSRKKRRVQLYNAEHVYYTETQVIETYGTICHLCNLEIDMTAPRRNNKPGWELGLHIDHVIPLAKGGSDKIENVRPSHGRCNLSKGKR